MQDQRPDIGLLHRVPRELLPSSTVLLVDVGPAPALSGVFGGTLQHVNRDRHRTGVRMMTPLVTRSMLAYMRRTTVKLPDDLDARLRHEAERRGTTVSDLTREAIEAHLSGGRASRRLLAAGAGASRQADISERVEEILAGETVQSR
jgi:predicted transcriptional regulator